MSTRIAQVTSDAYWKQPFNTVCYHKRLQEYMVLDTEEVRGDGGRPVSKGKHTLIDVTVARAKDFGVNDDQLTCRSHLGGVIQPGDLVWGFDVQTSNFNDEHANKLDRSQLPDVILVKKSYSEKRKTRKKRRQWKLRELPKIEDEGMTKKDHEQNLNDFEGFMQDLEEDPELRSTINIYRDPAYAQGPESEIDDDELRVQLDEMLDEFDAMDIEDEDAAEAGGAAGGVEGDDDERRIKNDRAPKRTRVVPMEE
eukprot:m.770398 g.770398  ORF g.770398 m.770398 type:complete len:253 (+) comp23240_c0_seq16:341-1099(+)